MLLKSLFSIASPLGLLAFDGGGAADADVYLSPTARQALVPGMPVAMPEPAVHADVDGLRQSASWQPAPAMRHRQVEGAVILATCGYFAFGAAGLLHWI